MDGAAQDPAEAAEIIYEEAGRLNRMVVELTDLERLQAGKLSMASDDIDMAQLSEAVVLSLMVVAEKRQIELASSVEPTPMIIGDGDRLAQVLMNLISNALKYTPAGGSVRVTARARRGWRGCLDKRQRQLAFRARSCRASSNAFYQVDKARGPQRGTGLGLAIAREIVEAHGGRITVSSRGRNQGAEFRVWLPSASQPPRLNREPWSRHSLSLYRACHRHRKPAPAKPTTPTRCRHAENSDRRPSARSIPRHRPAPSLAADNGRRTLPPEYSRAISPFIKTDRKRFGSDHQMDAPALGMKELDFAQQAVGRHPVGFSRQEVGIADELGHLHIHGPVV